MNKIIDHFKTIASIPHCSGEAEALYAFLTAYAQSHGYRVTTDHAKNILASRGKPTLCLQSHYDMVCMGEAPTIEVMEQEGWMHAKDASLGADNGMGIAMMMALMEEGVEVEFLFTADEEIGLIGANTLALELQATQMLNLDSEDEAEVYIGCAGGADIVAEVSGETIPGKGGCYEVAVRRLPGGHSGVDIDKNIPSAIKVLAEYLHDEGVEQLATIIAGERRNAIPANAVAIVCSKKALLNRGDVTVRPLSETPDVYKNSQKILAYLYRFEQGVRSRNEALEIPQTSINLAMVNDAYTPKGVTIEISARAMSMEDLEILIAQTASEMDMAGFSVRVEDKYPAWKPKENELSKRLESAMKSVFGHSKIMAIHAGLECGVLSQKFPEMLFASIGPTIRYPHSTRECVDVKSVERTYRVVQSIVQP
jgi:dipeptidase D